MHRTPRANAPNQLRCVMFPFPALMATLPPDARLLETPSRVGERGPAWMLSCLPLPPCCAVRKTSWAQFRR